MASKRKDDEFAKPASKVDSGTRASARHEESSSKKSKYVKEDPGMTAQQFADSAKNITISIGEDGNLGTLFAEPTVFSSGSYGWKANSKIRISVTVDGEEKEVPVLAGLNLTVSGSRPDGKKVSNGKRGRPRKNPVPDGVED